MNSNTNFFQIFGMRTNVAIPYSNSNNCHLFKHKSNCIYDKCLTINI